MGQMRRVLLQSYLCCVNSVAPHSMHGALINQSKQFCNTVNVFVHHVIVCHMGCHCFRCQLQTALVVMHNTTTQHGSV